MLPLLRSSHPGPAVAVTIVTVLLAIGAELGAWRCVLLGAAMLVGQLSVGWGNDAIDAERDRAVARADKPVATGAIGRRTVAVAAGLAAVVALALTLPLGPAALAAHGVFLVSAWAYNLGLKATLASIVPYLVSFGGLPWFVTLAAAEPAVAPWWATAAGALLGAAAHVTNVLPDLADDAATGVRGLPHRLGPTASGLLVALSLAGASAAVVLGPGRPTVPGLVGLAAVVVIAAVVAARVRRPGRALFRLIILAALIDVVLLATSGGLAT